MSFLAGRTNLFKLFGFVQIWNLATAEDVTDVFKERFLQRLSVIKQKHSGFVFHTGKIIQTLQIWQKDKTALMRITKRVGIQSDIHHNYIWHWVKGISF